MREDFTVTCYTVDRVAGGSSDWLVTLKWEKEIAHKYHSNKYVLNKFIIDQAALFINPLRLTEDAQGVIVVGASLTLRDGEELTANGLEAGWNMSGDAREHPAISELLALEHFTVYALDGNTGHVLWQVRVSPMIRMAAQ